MKLELKEILSESILFYKANFKKLTIFASIMFFCGLINAVISYLDAIYPSTILIMVALLIFFLIVIIIYPKFTLAIPIYVDSILRNNNMSFVDAYRKTKGKYWISAGFLLIILLLALPVMLLTKEPYKIIIDNVYSLFIWAFFFVTFPLIALENKSNKYLSKSIKLLKGNFFNFLALEFLTVTTFVVIYDVFRYVYKEQPLQILIIASIYGFIRFFVSPFAHTVTIVAYRKLVIPSENDDIIKYQTKWTITDSYDREHSIVYKGLKSFGNIKLVVDGEKRDYALYTVRKIGWFAILTVSGKEIIFKVPFHGENADLAVDGVFLGSHENISFNDVINVSEEGTPEYVNITNRIKRGFGSFLTMIVLTYLNIFLLLVNSNVTFPFSTFVPTVLASIAAGEAAFTEAIIPAIIAIVLTSLFLLLYYLSKKHTAALWISFILFILDTVLLIWLCMGDLSSALIDIAFHAWVIYTLISLIQAKTKRDKYLAS